MSISSDAKMRLLARIFASHPKGKNERALIYEEARFQGLGEDFVKMLLQELVDDGKIRRTIHGTKRFKTVSDKERKITVRYYYGRG